VCDAGTGSVEAGAARDDLIKRVGSKSALGEYLATLTRRCALLSFGRQMLAEVRPVVKAVALVCLLLCSRLSRLRVAAYAL
jgi:hypothetical protein